MRRETLGRVGPPRWPGEIVQDRSGPVPDPQGSWISAPTVDAILPILLGPPAGFTGVSA